MGALVRILIVDDEELIGRVMRRALAEHEVDVAESAAEGLALHAALPYALAFVDVGLPDTPGPDLARALECSSPLRVVLIGGGDLSLYRATGAEVLEKPFDFTQLRAVVANDPR
jgi:DNA-binding response OmpR family regulator